MSTLRPYYYNYSSNRITSWPGEIGTLYSNNESVQLSSMQTIDLQRRDIPRMVIRQTHVVALDDRFTRRNESETAMRSLSVKVRIHSHKCCSVLPALYRPSCSLPCQAMAASHTISQALGRPDGRNALSLVTLKFLFKHESLLPRFTVRVDCAATHSIVQT